MAAPAIGLRPRWRTSATPAIDWSHPLAAGLVACHYPTASGVPDLAGNAPLTFTGSPTVGPSAWGPGLAAATSSDGASRVTGNTGPLALNPPMTVAWVGQVNATPDAFAHFYGFSYSNPAGSPWVAGTFGTRTSGTDLGWCNNNAGGETNAEASGVITLGPHVFVGVTTSAESSLYVDGLRVATVAGWTTINRSSTTTLTCGFFLPGNGDTTRSTMSLGLIWARGLTPGEIGALQADPFCMLRR